MPALPPGTTPMDRGLRMMRALNCKSATAARIVFSATLSMSTTAASSGAKMPFHIDSRERRP